MVKHKELGYLARSLSKLLPSQRKVLEVALISKDIKATFKRFDRFEYCILRQNIELHEKSKILPVFDLSLLA